MPVESRQQCVCVLKCGCLFGFAKPTKMSGYNSLWCKYMLPWDPQCDCFRHIYSLGTSEMIRIEGRIRLIWSTQRGQVWQRAPCCCILSVMVILRIGTKHFIYKSI